MAPTTTNSVLWVRSYLFLLMICLAGAVHFEAAFGLDKLLVDSQQQKVRLRERRDVLVKHKTQHLKPAIEIEPINEKTKVAMPHFNVQDLTGYANQAAAAIASRFDEFEPTLLASNGQSTSHLSRKCVISLHYLHCPVNRQQIGHIQRRLVHGRLPQDQSGGQEHFTHRPDGRRDDQIHCARVTITT